MRSCLGLLAALALATPASAQTIYHTSFDDDSGWALEGPQHGDPGWKVDGLPANAPFGAFHSSPSSLSYNNGVNYEFATASLLKLEARSPWIDTSSATGLLVATFWCNNQTAEGICDVHELFRFHLTGATLECFEYWGTLADCKQSPGWPGWHRHSMALWSNPGQVQARIETRVDSIANGTAGLFIDDFTITNHRAPLVYCTAKLNSLGCTPTIAWSGLPSLGDGAAFHVTAAQVVSHSAGILIYGTGGSAATPFYGGVLCVGGSVIRTPLQASGGGPPPVDCTGGFTFDFLAWAKSGADPTLVEGVQVNAQYWYRDPGDATTVGLTDALEFVLVP